MVKALRAAGALLCALMVMAQAPLDQLKRADGAHVLPDHFLRRWDPVTILFDGDAGPAQGGPEDAPERFVTLAPAKPGSWRWIGRRTLQFRPTEPWEPLWREAVTAAGVTTTLIPLLPVPTATGPSDDPNGTANLDTIALSFDQPVDMAALARLLTITLTPQPGVTGVGTQTLTAADFTVRPVERAKPSDPQTYLVTLRTPLPQGRIATLRLLLSDEPGLDDPIFSLPLHSAAPFAVTDRYCGGGFNHSLVDGVVQCDPDPDETAQKRAIVLQFSAQPAPVDIVQGRDALRFTPPVDGLELTTGDDNSLTITAGFAADQVYHLSVAAGALTDIGGRPLAVAVESDFRFQPSAPALAWDTQDGMAEALGPQMVPLRGHGYDHADLRIYPIDPLSRDFWPFPSGAVSTSDSQSPPLPGREPRRYVELAPISADAMMARIYALGSPAVSDLYTLPIHRGGLDAKFGLDLAPSLARIAGPRMPGTYLLGLRTVDGQTRQWARLQVTDLALSTVEAPGQVRFVVTSLATAQPVAGAEVRLEGVRDGQFGTLAQGVTDAAGGWTLAGQIATGRDGKAALRRLVVTKATDTLVLDPARGPQVYAQGLWSPPDTPWLSRLTASRASTREPAQTLCHVFTERPIYRPEEPILIAGMIRRYQPGSLAFATGSGDVVVTAPDDQEWRQPVTLDEVGGFHVRFDQKTTATGEYKIAYQPAHGEPCGAFTVQKQAYRLPTFEVVLTAPAHAALDAPFDVDLLARFFAGGTLTDRPITWRVTQFPFAWTPPGRDGFLFSSDSRFSGDSSFRSTPVLGRDATTDAGGSAQLTLDPTIEPTAQPRQYVVEATVTGDDDQQVRGVQRITALPPFVLGVKVPRYLPQPGAIEPEIVALDGDGHEVTGLAMTAKLVHRQWNSVLEASDFAQGAAKYQTQVLDQTVEERHVVSTAAAQTVHFGAMEAGVYLVELSATDRAGRTQTVRVDLFMAGTTPVTWVQPPSQTVTVSTEHESYDPGQTATLLIQSPFQTARALAIVEEPGQPFQYDWVDVRDGVGRYDVAIRKEQGPRLAVHFLLMRGRLPGPPVPNAPFDQGKPVTLAATHWVTVTPVQNQVKVSFEAPASARPGQAIDLVLHLADAAGRPVAGEATVWLVDQAVLSLAHERSLDALPAFLVERPSRLSARDTRSMVLGVIPLAETPGGDTGAGEPPGVPNITVRKNFTPVPFYAPRVQVGPSGAATLHVTLPDSLTVFMLRAEAISGPDRFGFGTGELRVRQPVVAQAVLPRFVRPGDVFTAGLLGRVVEGPGGAGVAAISTDNLTVQGAAEQAVRWDGPQPVRSLYTVSVPEPKDGATLARVRFLLQRSADQAGDAVQIDLPIRPDRPVVHRRDLLVVGAANALQIPALADPVRPPSYSRSVTLATDPVVTRLVAGLNLLVRPAVGGTAQRIDLALAELPLLPFTSILDAAGLRDRLAGDVAAAQTAIRQGLDDDGLVAFFPNSRGMVWLTASALRVMTEAGQAGLPVDKAVADRLVQVLRNSLRSDYPHLLDDEEWFERVSALYALTGAGQAAPGYADELARRAAELHTGALATVATVLARLPDGNKRLLGEVLDTLWQRVNVLERDGKPVYQGLADQGGGALILPSEARSLAQTLEAVASATPDDPRLSVLRAGLLGLSTGQGWGNTNATSAALQALAASWQPPAAPVDALVTLPDRPVEGVLDHAHPLLKAITAAPGPIHVQAASGIAVLASTDYVPLQPGALATPDQRGLILTRTLYRVPRAQGANQPPMARLDAGPDGAVHLAVGDVVEEVDEVVTPEDRPQVALRLPVAAGLEPLNPALATATADATPSAAPTLAPSWSSIGDDEVVAVWLELPRGTFVLRQRLRATTAGSFTQPPGSAELLYQPGVNGSSAGARIVVAPTGVP